MCGKLRELPGSQFPLGATVRDGGTNFAVAASAADAMLLCLFDGDGAETQVPLTDYDAGVWHGFVPGVGAGQAYGYRAAGRYDPGSGLRFNAAKLLLDPYARAIAGAVTFGPEVFGYAAGDPNAPSTLDSAAHVPRSLVVDDAYQWSGQRAAQAPLRGHDHLRGARQGLHDASPGGAAANFAEPTRASGTRRPSAIWSASA